MDHEKLIHGKFLRMNPMLNERSRRLWDALGRGGVSVVSRATGIARLTIAKGIAELHASPVVELSRLRKAGGGRKKLTKKDATLERDLEALVESTTRGDPESTLRYTIKSTRSLMRELEKQGHTITYPTIASLLHEKGYNLQANQKTIEGRQHPDRNAQFEFIGEDTKRQIARKEPVISVDTKKKELVGNFKNAGREWHRKGSPVKVKVHDFVIPEFGKAVPYGVYDLGRNHGWVNVGIDADTAAFAVESIRRWWRKTGRARYPRAKTLTITADSGGSNSSRSRLWKRELQRFSNKTRLCIRVRHFPPGTSKWNKIEHRLFSFISQNWRGKPLLTHAVIINLIAATKTTTGLTVDCMLDTNTYPCGIKIPDSEYAMIRIVPDSFHGDWNYTIMPNKR
ncbi:MAG: ISAzo13 family transposase [Candidatus Omnitrophica bacterium]|nr:ISAzo13 family transposase [Candidatus Omnitrophota bacterium]